MGDKHRSALIAVVLRAHKGWNALSLVGHSPHDALADLLLERGDDELTNFVELYYEEAPDHVFGDARTDDLLGAAVSHRELMLHREPARPAVRVYNPSYEVDGWSSSHSVLQIVADDSPFIVDSVSAAVERAGYSMHRIIHPVIRVKRNGNGSVVGVADGEGGARASAGGANVDGDPESLVSVEFDRIVDTVAIEMLRADVEHTLDQVAAAVNDWPAMVTDADQVAAEVADEETSAFIEWMIANNFIFLGYRRYELVGDGDNASLALRSIPTSGSGILRSDSGAEPSLVRFADLPPQIGARATTLAPIHITKTNGRSIIHRQVRMDYVGVKIIEGDRVVGEHRFIGLFTAASYRLPLSEIPILRRIVADTIDASGYAPGSHNASELLAAIDRYPRDELFLLGPDELLETTTAIVHLGRRREVAVFARQEPFGRYVSCLVLFPRDLLTTALRQRIEKILTEAFDATEIDYTTQVADSAHAQLHYLISHRQSAEMPDLEAVRSVIAQAARSWSDELRVSLRDTFGDAAGGQLYQRYANAFSPAFVDHYSTRAAVSDIARFEADGVRFGVELSRPLGAPEGRLQAKIHQFDQEIRLSDVLPVLQNLGADVLHERPYDIEPSDGPTIHLYDFGLDVEAGNHVDTADLKTRFEDAFLRAWRGEIETNGFNRLVLIGGLSWPEVRVTRAYAAYFRQIGARFSSSYVADTLIDNFEITRSLIDLFTTRFDPNLAEEEREATAATVLKGLDEAIEDVVELDEDRILRAARNLVLATTRTNFFQRLPDGQPKPYLTLKFDPRAIPDVRPPLPRYETFVFSARTEGIHLRGGEVARGGIRWSTRLEDYRTEVLDLMTTQVAKNSIIVPTGAKGGFISKRLHLSDDRATVAAEVQACYQTFISGLIDITDNRVNAETVAAPDVVSYDDDGSYLVVAADKGTATFSDVANEMAIERGFWLGDAFASGGSAGYDHKEMGITARGAWESVRRHFRALDLDVDVDRFTVVGIGDMSGDVFGNGMLLSSKIALIGAFDHRHVMVDPTPDPDLGFAERRRLFDLPASSWNDYDRKALSPGGAVFSRSAKSIEPSAEIREALDLPLDVQSFTPNELIRRLLLARYDLLWNGGIGTFVKSADESDLDASDKANDGIRVNADALRCRVIGEGGNLGLTQRARVDFALGGGSVFSDAIDNSAGVATSDIEVNIKILLDAVVAAGDLTAKQRDELLAAMTREVGELILRGNYAQGRAIENAFAERFEMLDVHERLIAALVERDFLDPVLERFPDAEELTNRRANRIGLTAPELSVLLAQTKNALTAELAAAEVGLEPCFDELLVSYFPSDLRTRYKPQILDHRLRNELLSTIVANRVVDRGGLTMVMRLADETGSAWPDVARAHVAAWTLFSMEEAWDEIERLDNNVRAELQTEMLLRGRRLVERSTRWLLRQRRHPIDVTAIIGDFAAWMDDTRKQIDIERSKPQRADHEAAERRLTAAGVPAPVAKRSVAHDRLVRALDIIETSRVMNCSVPEATKVWFGLETNLGIDWLHLAIAGLPRTERWESLARSALREDLSHTHAELTTSVLRQRTSRTAAIQDSAVDHWLSANAQDIERVANLRAAVVDDPSPGLESLTVLLRELRRLVAD